MIVECPSGLIVKMRKLKVAEANILADRQAQQRGAQLDQLLKSVHEETVALGPYSDPINWEEVLLGDRFYAQMRVRAATHGEDYDFRVPCTVCKSAINWSLNLSTLPLRRLAPEDLATFKAGNQFKDIGPDGREITFHLMTGRHEKKAQQILRSNRTERVTASLLARVEAVEGVPDKAKYLSNLDFDIALALIDMLDSHDCGVETDIEVECTECYATSEVMLPLDQPTYWGGSMKKRTRAAT